MNFKPLSLADCFPSALFDRLLGEIRAFSQHKNESLTDAWLRMKKMLRNCHGHNLSKGNIIKIFYHGLNEVTQEVLNAATGGIFLYKTPNQAYPLLEDKVLLKLNWAKNQKTKSSLKKTVAFADEGSSNFDTNKIIARMDAMTLKMDAQYKELQSKKTNPILMMMTPPMLERGSYIPWESRFRRYINRKRENQKWLNKALDEGPYRFQMFVPSDSTVSKLQTAEDLQGDALLYYDAEIEVMNLILLFIPNDIYTSVDACTFAKDMWKRVDLDTFDDLFDYLRQFEKLVNTSRAKQLEKSHDPLALVAQMGSSSRNMSSYYVTHPTYVVDYDDEYQQDDILTNSEKPLTSAMLLLARAITQNFSNPTNNHLRTSSNTRNQAVIQGDRVNIQSRNSGNAERNNRRAYVQEEVVEGSNESGNVQRTLRNSSSGNTSTVQCYNYSGKGHYARNCPKPRVRDSKYFMEQMLLAKQDEAGVILTDEQNDFLFVDASRMEEIEDLGGNICLMDRIQPTNQSSDVGPSYDSAFVSEVQSSFINENEEQMYPTHTKIINTTIGDDQIDSNIIFDKPNGNVNSGSVKKDTHVPDLCALEQLARNAYQEAEKQQIFDQKVQKQNKTLTSQLELYKERVQALENINEDNNYLNEFLEADQRAKYFDQQAQSQFIRDRDIIRDPEKQRDKLETLFQRDIKEMKDVFESTESELCELKKQNDFLKDQLLEASLKHQVEISALLNHECVDNFLHAEIEHIKRKPIEIQEELQARIKILEKVIQRCEKQSVDFELKLQHEKEKHKWDSTLPNNNTKSLDYPWISKMEKLKHENVSLDFQVQSLIKEHDNVKAEYQKLFDTIKKTRYQTQKEIDELIAHVSEKTYAYGAIRDENQNLLFIISELKTRLKNVEKGKSVNTKFDTTNGSQTPLCATPINKHAFQKKTDVSKTEGNHVVSKQVTLQTSPNKQSGANSNKNENVIDVDVANASKAKNLLCVSCMQNVIIPCHDRCLANHRLNMHSNARRTLSTKSRTPKSSDTTYVVLKTRFSEKLAQSKTLDTTSVVSKPKIDVGSASKAKNKVVQIVLWIVDSGCSKHMTGDRSLLRNCIENFMGTVRFGNDNFAAIISYGGYIQGNITICHVYYVKGLGHNLFSVGQFCDGDLEVAFHSKTCYTRNLEGDDLLTGGRESNLYTISISNMAASSPVCLMSKATSTKSWLWHRRLSHLNFGSINDLTRLDLVDGLPKFKYEKDHLCSGCKRGKIKKASHPPKLVSSGNSKLELLYMDLCGPMQVASINGKKYILVIVDDYSRYTWVYFLHSKDETPKIIKKFIAQAQLNYKVKVCKIRTDNGTEFKNATLKAHYEKLGIMQQFLTARTP
nr:retrovirus-related Pol polyprotein from transposon TNT 1-94 [Tanacetum cinerariifolium]